MAVSDRWHLLLCGRHDGRRRAASRSSVADRRRAAATAAQQTEQLFAKHPAADRVQKEVDGESGDVQRLGVVSEDVEEREPDVDDSRPLHLEQHEVDENRQIEQDVGGRDKDEDDGQLEVSFVEAGASTNATRVGVAIGNGRCALRPRREAGRRGGGVGGRFDGEQQEVLAPTSPVVGDARHARHNERVQQSDRADRNHTQDDHFRQVHHGEHLACSKYTTWLLL